MGRRETGRGMGAVVTRLDVGTEERAATVEDLLAEKEIWSWHEGSVVVIDDRDIADGNTATIVIRQAAGRVDDAGEVRE
jgi:hypothetical protein